MVLINILIALFFLYLGGSIAAFAVAAFILESSEAEILAKVREIKNIAKE